MPKLVLPITAALQTTCNPESRQGDKHSRQDCCCVCWRLHLISLLHYFFFYNRPKQSPGYPDVRVNVTFMAVIFITIWCPAVPPYFVFLHMGRESCVTLQHCAVVSTALSPSSGQDAGWGGTGPHIMLCLVLMPSVPWRFSCPMTLHKTWSQCEQQQNF